MEKNQMFIKKVILYLACVSWVFKPTKYNKMFWKLEILVMGWLTLIIYLVTDTFGHFMALFQFVVIGITLAVLLRASHIMKFYLMYWENKK